MSCLRGWNSGGLDSFLPLAWLGAAIYYVVISPANLRIIRVRSATSSLSRSAQIWKKKVSVVFNFARAGLDIIADLFGSWIVFLNWGSATIRISASLKFVDLKISIFLCYQAESSTVCTRTSSKVHYHLNHTSSKFFIVRPLSYLFIQPSQSYHRTFDCTFSTKFSTKIIRLLRCLFDCTSLIVCSISYVFHYHTSFTVPLSPYLLHYASFTVPPPLYLLHCNYFTVPPSPSSFVIHLTLYVLHCIFL